MNNPPPGYLDMLSDAEEVETRSRFVKLKVDDEVGWVRARKPLPNAAPIIAMAARSKATAAERVRYVTEFVTDHIEEDELDRLLFEQMIGERPEDTIGRVARALSVWGTERPYTAVVTLTVMAAHHWRLLRLEFALAGIERPMEMPTMHVLLDRVEKLILESMQSDKPKQDEAKRKSFLNDLYKPEPLSVKRIEAIKGMTPRERRLAAKAARAEAPIGFETEAIEASFDAFGSRSR